LLTEYIRQRKIEEAVARKKREKSKELKQNLKKYDLKTKPITKEELKK
jgi:cobalamin biosynthesis protein CbiG